MLIPRLDRHLVGWGWIVLTELLLSDRSHSVVQLNQFYSVHSFMVCDSAEAEVVASTTNSCSIPLMCAPPTHR